MTRFVIVLLIIAGYCIFDSEGAQNRSSKVQLTARFRTMISDKMNAKQVMTLTQSLADLIISNYSLPELKYEMAERLLTVLKPFQRVDLVAAFDCYQNNLGENVTKNLFIKTGNVITSFLLPSFNDIYGQQLKSFRALGFNSVQQRNAVMTKLNSIISEGMIRNIFTSLSQRLTKKEISFHKNCGGRIIKFKKYFVIEPLK